MMHDPWFWLCALMCLVVAVVVFIIVCPPGPHDGPSDKAGRL